MLLFLCSKSVVYRWDFVKRHDEFRAVVTCPRFFQNICAPRYRNKQNENSSLYRCLFFAQSICLCDKAPWKYQISWPPINVSARIMGSELFGTKKAQDADVSAGWSLSLRFFFLMQPVDDCSATSVNCCSRWRFNCNNQNDAHARVLLI